MWVLDRNNLALCAIVTAGMQLVFFLVAVTFKFDKVTDFAGGSNFVVLAVMTFFLAAPAYLDRQIAVTVMVVFWGVRLAGFLLYRIIKVGKDERFDGTRESPLKFAGFWVFQAVWVFAVSLPVMLINSPTLPQPREFWSAADICGIIMWSVGFIIEVLADQQKFDFKNNMQNKGKYCDVGIWSWSRHPNYFGEILLWYGIFTMFTPMINESWMWIGILSPIFTSLLLLFLSGIPPTEKLADEKYGSDPDYQMYKSSTSPLIPVPPAFYGRLPYAVKLILFLEFPFYNHLPDYKLR